MRLLSYRVHDRESYGLQRGDGIVDLGRRLGANYPTLLTVLRAGLLAQIEALRNEHVDHELAEVVLLPPIAAPEKIWCIGVNYAERNEGIPGQLGASEVPEPVLPRADLHRRPRYAA